MITIANNIIDVDNQPSYDTSINIFPSDETMNIIIPNEKKLGICKCIGDQQHKKPAANCISKVAVSRQRFPCSITRNHTE